MLRQAGEPLGIAVFPVGLDAEPEAVPYQQSVITAEIERWPETPLTKELARHNAFINRDIFPRLVDRFPQKSLFDSLQLSTAPWALLESPEQWPELFATLGEFLIVKRRTGGYEVNGVFALVMKKTCLLKFMVNASLNKVSLLTRKCLSLVPEMQRGIRFYPITHNLHQEGILRTSVAFLSQLIRSKNKLKPCSAQ